MSAAAAGASAGAAAIAKATRAAGIFIHVEPPDFLSVITREPQMLVVHAVGGLLTTSYQYLTSYRGLAFYTTATSPLPLPKGVEVIEAKRIWIP